MTAGKNPKLTNVDLWIHAADIPAAVSRMRKNMSRIERTEVLLRQDRAAVFRRLEIEINEFVHAATLQEAEHLAQG